jgi:hypothetical protein
VPGEPVGVVVDKDIGKPARPDWWAIITEIGRMLGYADAWDRSLGGSLASLNDIVMPRVAEARALQQAGFHGPAVVSAYTAIELTLESVVVRPFVMAGFMTEDLARVFADHILRAPGVEHRKMVSRISKLIDVDLNNLRLGDGTPLWDLVTGSLPTLRNRIVHEGAVATPDEGEGAVNAAAQFVHDFALPLFAGIAPDAPGVHGRRPYRAGPTKHPLTKLMESVTDAQGSNKTRQPEGDRARRKTPKGP